MSRFESVVSDNQQAAWNWSLVSSNPSISFEFISKNPTLPWVPKYVSSNPNITQKDIVSNLEYPWDFEGLCSNPNLSLDFFNEYIVKPDVVHRVDWHLISANPSIIMMDVINYSNYAWNDRYLSMNPNLTSNFILNEGKGRKWFVPYVSSNSGIGERDIFKSTLKSMFEWDYRNLSANVNLPIAYVSDNITKDWNFHSISANASLQDINKFHKVKWDGHGLSLNPNINFDYVQTHNNIQWHYPSLLMNKGISFETIIDNYAFFKSQLGSPYVETLMSSNPNISNQWISQNSSLVDWKRLSSNTLN